MTRRLPVVRFPSSGLPMARCFPNPERPAPFPRFLTGRDRAGWSPVGPNPRSPNPVGLGRPPLRVRVHTSAHPALLLLVRGVLRRRSGDDDLPVRHLDVEVNLVEVAFVMMFVRCLHDNATAHDVFEELVLLTLEPRGADLESPS